jgi:hypothetical protein
MKRSRIWLSDRHEVDARPGGLRWRTPAPIQRAPPPAGPRASPDGGDGHGNGGELTPVSLQLQWAPQAQFAGYFAARSWATTRTRASTSHPRRRAGRHPAGRRDRRRTAPSSRSAGCPRCSRPASPARPRQHRPGLPALRHAVGRVGRQRHHLARRLRGQARRRLGLRQRVRGHRRRAAGRPRGGRRLREGHPAFDMIAFLNREIDVAEAMIYNEYAQVLEAENPETGRALPARGPQRHRLQRGRHGHAPGRDLRPGELARRGRQRGRRGALPARQRSAAGSLPRQPDDCIEHTVDAGSTLGTGHQALDDERDQPAHLAVAGRHRP